MSEVYLSASERERKQPDRRLAAPELDESLWLVWKEKNRAKDRIRAAHRRRVLIALIALVAVALIAAYSMGAIA